MSEAASEDGYFELEGAAPPTFLVFGGINRGLGLRDLPPFEFARTLQAKGHRVIFLRDANQAWYQKGVEPLGATIPEVAATLEDMIGDDRLVTLGNSMGGFAALLFGALLDADLRIAFSPQTFVDEETRQETGDERWQKQMRAMHGDIEDLTFLDLLPVLKASGPGTGRGYLFFAEDDALDSLHARRLAGLKNHRIVALGEGQHQVAATLRARGVLDALIDGAAQSAAEGGNQIEELIAGEPLFSRVA